MNLKELADLSGVKTFRCDKEWGGTWAYTTADHPKTSICGFRNEAALYKSWAEETFGKNTFKALSKLLK